MSLGVAGQGVGCFGGLAGKYTDFLVKRADNAAQLMADVFSIGGEDAILKSGVAEMVADRTADVARAKQLSGWLDNVGTGMSVVGTAGTTVEQAMETSAQTWLGKITSTGAAGGFSWAARNNGIIGAADAVGGVLGTDTPSGIWNASVESIVVTGEGLVTGDTRGMATLHQKQLNGDWGPLFRGGRGGRFLG